MNAFHASLTQLENTRRSYLLSRIIIYNPVLNRVNEAWNAKIGYSFATRGAASKYALNEPVKQSAL